MVNLTVSRLRNKAASAQASKSSDAFFVENGRCSPIVTTIFQSKRNGRVSRPAAALSASGHSHVGVGRVVDLVLDETCRPQRLLQYGPDHGDGDRVAQHHADGAVGQVQCRRRRRDDVLLLEALSLVGGFDVVGRQPLAWMFYDLASASRRSLIDD